MIRKLNNKKANDDDDMTTPQKPSISGNLSKGSSLSREVNDDRLSMALLLVLYTLQGIPMGLCGSIPLILKERHVSYEG